MIELHDVRYLHNNERDLEIPSLLASVAQKQNTVTSLLDVGAHYSWYHYADPLREIMTDKVYDGIDILPDEKTAAIVNNFYVGNVTEIDLKTYDYVSCVSTLEHCGLSTYKRGDFRQEQYDVFRAMLGVANNYLFLSFPFGLDDIYPNEYANVTDTQLSLLEHMAAWDGFDVSDIQFYFNEFAPGGQPWQIISRQEAAKKPMIKERGTQCVCLVEFSGRP